MLSRQLGQAAAEGDVVAPSVLFALLLLFLLFIIIIFFLIFVFCLLLLSGGSTLESGHVGESEATLGDGPRDEEAEQQRPNDYHRVAEGENVEHVLLLVVNENF